ncbi:hypothetical protein Pmani_023347 [Petrolisthes manimaculis]|uniref:C2H2-type domain-containing protein n=1 Tax=Petrolisthes manimaculis TaxID=1843537 RepID=A0AAE1NR11_9EUCA|nr:hypothetical protein Pmani_033165 [Petrolisthes manimaculis]KAK4304717.1 hypothetical protein Pmani_023347 [Petrolisthes manimaculis]
MSTSHCSSWHGLNHKNSMQATVSQVQHSKSYWQQLAAAAATSVRLSTNITGYIARSVGALHMGRSLSGLNPLGECMAPILSCICELDTEVRAGRPGYLTLLVAHYSHGHLSSLHPSPVSLFFPPRTWSTSTASLRPQLSLPPLAPLSFPPSSSPRGSAAAALAAQLSPMRPRILRPSHRPAHCPACGRYFTFGHNMKAHLKRCPKNPHRPPLVTSVTSVISTPATTTYVKPEPDTNHISPSVSPSILAEKLTADNGESLRAASD